MVSSDHRRQGSDASDCEMMLVDINRDSPAVQLPTRARRIGILAHAKARLRCEANLLRRQIRMYILCIFINIYGGSVVFRNFAFYRFEIGERITQDIGFQILPESRGILNTMPMFSLQVECIRVFSARLRHLQDTTNTYLQVFTLLSCAACFFPISDNPPYAVNIVRRWGIVEAQGTILRFLTYGSTTLPGAAEHCLPKNKDKIHKDRLKTARDILFTIKVDGIGVERNTGEKGTYNCGDLVFSGHMLMTMLYALAILRNVLLNFCDFVCVV